MTFSFQKPKGFKVGDLVGHYLHTRQWIGLVLKLHLLGEKCTVTERYDNEKALVKIIPGTKYQDYFYNLGKTDARLGQGWIYCKWLYIMDKGGKYEYKRIETNND
tara:strand:+ start:8096 stop:8410 length:315 start_codon:yes stop_codon:yes gene_type:complete